MWEKHLYFEVKSDVTKGDLVEISGPLTSWISLLVFEQMEEARFRRERRMSALAFRS